MSVLSAVTDFFKNKKMIRTVGIFVGVLIVSVFVLVSEIGKPEPAVPSQGAATLSVDKLKPDMSVPPRITKMSASPADKGGVAISWTTNKETTGELAYGTSKKYGTVLKDTKATLSHTIIIPTISFETPYYYEIRMTDAMRNTVIVGDTFRIAHPPKNDMPSIMLELTNVQVVSVGFDQAVISWTTNRNADTSIEYGYSTAYGETAYNAIPVTNHMVTISPLLGNHMYHFRVRSTDQSGYFNVSADLTLTTMAPLACPNTPATPDAGRSMFVPLYVDDIITPGSQKQNDFFSFTDAKKVQKVFLNADLPDLQNPVFVANMKTFLNTAWNQHCVSVELSSGDAGWVAFPGNNGGGSGVPIMINGTYTNEALDWVAAADTFIDSIVSPNIKPDGLHLDVEPHGFSIGNYPGTGPRWDWTPVNSQYVAVSYLDLLLLMRNALYTAKIKMNVDIPRWFDSTLILQNLQFHNASKSLMKHVVDMFNDITIFDYVVNGGPCVPPQYTTGSICDDASGEFLYAIQDSSKHIQLAVEAGDVQYQGSTNGVNSFWTMQCSQMDGPGGALASTYGHLNTNGFLPAFTGFAIDPYYEDNRPGSAVDSGYSILCP